MNPPPARPGTRPPPGSVRRLVESYDPAFRATMPIRAEDVDDPVAVEQAVVGLPPTSTGLLDTLLLAGPIGEGIPDRLRPTIDASAGPLWSAALLVPRTSVPSGGSILPRHYAASCRLNPALAGRRPTFVQLPALRDLRPGTDATTFPPSDARWDAVILAAWVEANPTPLTQDGGLRRDVEKRIVSALGGDHARWTLALAVARAQGIIRASGGRLDGFPEASPRPIADPTTLFEGRASRAAAAILVRVADSGWMDLDALLEHLRRECREVLYSPTDAPYGDTRRFDDAAWDLVEAPLFREALDTLNRAGVLDAHRDGTGPRTFRRAAPRERHDEGFLLTPDGEILLHVGGLGTPDFGRLARMAPWIDGDRLCRHRLTREGVGADLALGHLDAAGFLTSHSRTGLPPSVADMLREWQRSASRVTLLSGVDVEEDEDGKLRIVSAPPSGPYRTIDYTTTPRARFLYARGRITIPHGWDPLTVRAAVARIAEPTAPEPGEPDASAWIPARRNHRNVGELLDQLRAFHGGELPGEIETLVLAGGGLPPIRVESALVLHIPGPVAHALRRDWVAAPLLPRWLSNEEAVVSTSDLPRLRARLTELGLGWEGEA